ncbi:C1 family peptidase [Pedobacter sp. ASV28]|uniref:C1 family peptidase n=1 Tax=Pedobacter sp. ASV28 TaxID=2795123 RepID=UPI0018EC63F3|nr:C1 family peptidase [Pedobacter sp. ASV28]
MKNKETRVHRILNCTPSIISEKDFSFEDAKGAGFVVNKLKVIPETIDLRENWWNINDQGSTGSCVGWATADSLLRWHYIKKKLIKNSDLLSVRFIWMAAKETDIFNNRPSTFIEEAGTSLKAALDIARNYGCVNDSLLPFKSGKLYDSTENLFYVSASRLKILNYFNLIKGTSSKITNWKNWIAAGNGPILTRLDVDSTWDNASMNKGNLDRYYPSSARGGHAVSIVGYTKDRFIVRNSWGNTWGDDGFGYASLDYAEQAFTEAFGITI